MSTFNVTQIHPNLNHTSLKQFRTEVMRVNKTEAAKRLGFANSSYSFKERGVRPLVQSELLRVQEFINKNYAHHALSTAHSTPQPNAPVQTQVQPDPYAGLEGVQPMNKLMDAYEQEQKQKWAEQNLTAAGAAEVKDLL